MAKIRLRTSLYKLLNSLQDDCFEELQKYSKDKEGTTPQLILTKAELNR